MSFKLFSKSANWRLMERIHQLMVSYGQVWLASYLEAPAENESEVEVKIFSAIVPKRIQTKKPMDIKFLGPCFLLQAGY